VYSFGVILLETISLMSATSEKGRPKDAKECVSCIYCSGKQTRALARARILGDISIMYCLKFPLLEL
jgi:hypothetical protein